jgi:hypothetical protein
MEQPCASEVARLLEQIDQQYEAAQRGMSGLAQGAARHAFITARMERMGQMHQELGHLIGADQAIQLVVETLDEQLERQAEAKSKTD